LLDKNRLDTSVAKSLGQIGYEAYAEDAKLEAVKYGETVLSWKELVPAARKAWERAAEAIRIASRVIDTT
jgi:hypothetical protein